MLSRIAKLVLIVCLAAVTASAANDAFAGKWKLNQTKSTVTGEQLKITSAGENKYTISDGNVSDTIVADGTDQPIHFGLTQSITREMPNVWKIVTKKDGRVLYSGTWTLSQNGKRMNFEVTGTRPDGSKWVNHGVVRRISDGAGFAGMWESRSISMGSPDEWVIQPYGGDGLSFITPAEQDTLSMKFDGKDYAETGPDVPAGSTSSGRRMDEHTVAVTDKIQGKVMDTAEFKLSADLEALTVTVHEVGQTKPLIFVYDRE